MIAVDKRERADKVGMTRHIPCSAMLNIYITILLVK
jgi:hypothetical protein